MTVQLITITTRFLSKYCIKRILDIEMNWLSLFQFYRKTFFRSVDPKQPKNLTFSLWSIIETFPRGGAWLFRGGAKIIRGGAKILRGGAHFPTPPLKVRPWLKDIRPYSKSTLTLNEWRFNLSFSWVSVLFLNCSRVSSHRVRYDTSPPAIQKQH
jgi:hypothetical protein